MSIRNAMCVLAAGILCHSAAGATITWDFRNTSATPVTSSGPDMGNNLEFTAGDLRVLVSAWSLSTPEAAFQTAEVNQHSTGLGVCTFLEGTGCPDPAYLTDNVGQYEFVLFRFSRPVSQLTVAIDPVDTYDRDVSYAVGNMPDGEEFAGWTIADLLSAGFSARNDNGSVSDKVRAVPILSTGPVTALLLGAKVGDYDDRFVIRGLAAEAPEPGSLVVCGLVLAGAGLFRSRRRTGERPTGRRA